MFEAYTSEEKKLVEEYIFNQFSLKQAVFKKIESNGESSVSILQFSTNRHNVYVTLGVGGYIVPNKLRKDMQHFELIMMASKDITDEQEEVIVKQLSGLVAGCAEKGEPLGELHTVDWMNDNTPSCIKYSTFMLLRAAQPLELKKKSVQFMIALPLLTEESNWIDTEQRNDLFFHHHPGQTSREYVGYFLACFSAMYSGEEIFFVDETRRKACLAPGDNPRLPIFETISRYPDWGKTLKLSRTLASLPFVDLRTEKQQTIKNTPTGKNWKYENCEDGIMITRYIGYAEDVIVPDKINGKPVVRIKWEAFSPNACKGFKYSRNNEALMTIRTVTLPTTITSIESSMFDGCCCLENVSFSNNIKKIEPYAFLKCLSLKTTEYKNGIYLGTKGNPYYALIDVSPEAKSVCVHPKTKVIQDSTFVSYMNFELAYVEIPEGITCFSYEGDYAQYNPIFRVKKDSKASKFLVKNGFKVEFY